MVFGFFLSTAYIVNCPFTRRRFGIGNCQLKKVRIHFRETINDKGNTTIITSTIIAMCRITSAATRVRSLNRRARCLEKIRAGNETDFGFRTCEISENKESHFYVK